MVLTATTGSDQLAMSERLLICSCTVAPIAVWTTSLSFTRALWTFRYHGLLRAVLVVLLVAALSVGVLVSLRKVWQQFELALSIVAAVSVSACFAHVRAWKYPELWSGFGSTFVGILGLCAVSFLMSPSRFVSPMKRVIQISLLPSLVIVVFYVPLMLQPTYALLNFGDTTYHVLEEFMAPWVSGNFPLFNFSAQYGSMLGYLFWPVKLVFGESILAAVISLNLLNALVPVISLYVLRKIRISNYPIWQLLGLLSLWLVSGPYGGSSTQIAEAGGAARLVPSLAAVAASSAILSDRNRSNMRIRIGWACAGLLASLAALNNADLGLGVFIAILLTHAIRWVCQGFSAIEFLSFTYPIVCSFALFLAWPGFSTGPKERLALWIGIRTAPERMYERLDVVSYIPASLFAALVGVAIVSTVMRIVGFKRSRGLRHLEGNEYITFLIAIWSLFFLGKFYFGGAIQGVPQMFVPAFLLGWAILSRVNWSLKESCSYSYRLRKLLVPSLLMLAPIASLGFASDPRDEWKRLIIHQGQTTDWSRVLGRPNDVYSRNQNPIPNGVALDVRGIAEKLRNGGSHVGYFGYLGSTMTALTGVESVFSMTAIESMRFADFESIVCTKIRSTTFDEVLVWLARFPCDGYFLASKHAASDGTEVLQYRLRSTRLADL